MLQQPNLSDEQATAILDHLYMVANVVADAFAECKRKPVTMVTEAIPVEMHLQSKLTSPVA